MRFARLITLLFVSTTVAIGTADAFENIRQVPAREVPVPDTASPELQAFIGAPLQPIWNTHPKSAEEWKTFVQQRADFSLKALPGLREHLGVKVEPDVISGVKVFRVTSLASKSSG